MRRSLVSKRSAMLLLAALPLVGCPDPDAAYDDYVARRPAPPSAPDVGDRDAIAGGMLPDVTGTHLLAIATFIDNDRPLLFHADVVLTPSASPTPAVANTLTIVAARKPIWNGYIGTVRIAIRYAPMPKNEAIPRCTNPV